MSARKSRVCGSSERPRKKGSARRAFRARAVVRSTHGVAAQLKAAAAEVRQLAGMHEGGADLDALERQELQAAELLQELIAGSEGKWITLILLGDDADELRLLALSLEERADDLDPTVQNAEPKSKSPTAKAAVEDRALVIDALRDALADYETSHHDLYLLTCTLDAQAKRLFNHGISRAAHRVLDWGCERHYERAPVAAHLAIAVLLAEQKLEHRTVAALLKAVAQEWEER